MNTPTPSLVQGQRVDVADVLRGFAVMAIILLHSIEHFNFYYFPAEVPFEWMRFTDRAIWDGLFFAFGGKAYAIFALLFGFSFYIMDSKQQANGKDFRCRFMWRMILLFLIGQFNAAFFTGEILTLYALIGIVVLPLCCRLSNHTIVAIAVIMLIQPIDIAKIIYALFNPEYAGGESLAMKYFGIAAEVQKNGTFLQTIRMNLWEGQLANITWAIEHGRITQTAGLFLTGMLAGRTGFFLHTAENEQRWLKILGMALLCFFPLYGLYNMMPGFIENKAILTPLQLIISSLRNLSFMAILTVGIMLTFYRSKRRSFFMLFSPYGRMSMTHYIGQSVIGSLCFYHWGFFLAEKLGITYSFIFGIVFVLFQMIFSHLWFKQYKYGPFEGVWRRLTWVGRKR